MPGLYQAAHAPPVTKSKAGWTSGALEEALLEGPALVLVVEKENAASRLSMLFRGGGASSRGFRAGGGAAQAGPIARYSSLSPLNLHAHPLTLAFSGWRSAAAEYPAMICASTSSKSAEADITLLFDELHGSWASLV